MTNEYLLCYCKTEIREALDFVMNLFEAVDLEWLLAVLKGWVYASLWDLEPWCYLRFPIFDYCEKNFGDKSFDIFSLIYYDVRFVPIGGVITPTIEIQGVTYDLTVELNK